MEIQILKQQKRVDLRVRPLKTFLRLACRQLGLSEGELSVLLTDDKTIKNLNRRYRNVNKATDVLAFPFKSGRLAAKGIRLPIGEIVISLDTASAQAKSLGTTLKKEVEVLLIHGLLHILGYDDSTEKKRARMERKTQKILKAIGKQI